ncbi:conserved hypothetical protein [gamma proteobacterium HdN1]|nr:conserved hypothetical protein [gamma proteobacterium HdN1]
MVSDSGWFQIVDGFSTFFAALYIQIPVVIGGVLHMLAVTKDWLPALKVPIHERLFGANKTWRGMVLVPLFTALGAICIWPLEWLLGPHAVFGTSLLLAGVVAGFGYVLAELPNSWFKRRAGIPPGVVPTRAPGLFIFLDQFDSGLGVALAYLIYPGFGVQVFFWYILTFPITALLVKRWLFWMKLKKSAV